MAGGLPGQGFGFLQAPGLHPHADHDVQGVGAAVAGGAVERWWGPIWVVVSAVGRPLTEREQRLLAEVEQDRGEQGAVFERRLRTM